LLVVATTLNEIGPPSTSTELRILVTPGFSSSFWMNGGEVKWLSISPPADRKVAIASGCDIDTVIGSSLA
jgi:hypothetical protein